MNKVILMGRLTKDPEIRYTGKGEPIAIARYTIAVSRPYKKDGQTQADFINVVSYRKAAEFIEKYFKKRSDDSHCWAAAGAKLGRFRRQKTLVNGSHHGRNPFCRRKK